MHVLVITGRCMDCVGFNDMVSIITKLSTKGVFSLWLSTPQVYSLAHEGVINLLSCKDLFMGEIFI